MFSTPLIMGFFKVPDLTTTKGKPMSKSDLKMLVISVLATMIAAFVGIKYVPYKSTQTWGLLIILALSCLMSVARIIEDSRKRCKL
jgi:ABC-type Mn2+/Zn2+ transport system permease subunit